ncbi:hypothetical protein CLU81_0613 [Flavobacterium sp. 9]|nr:hypothetical protein CLU81_0613 [Flavobacterium sp. 9]
MHVYFLFSELFIFNIYANNIRSHIGSSGIMTITYLEGIPVFKTKKSIKGSKFHSHSKETGVKLRQIIVAGVVMFRT